MIGRTRTRGLVLLVEDDTAIARVLTSLLQGEGHIVHVVCDGQAALDYLKAGSLPDVIVLELALPVMDGWEFRKRQLGDPGLVHVPVVVLTGAQDTVGGALTLQAAAYLTKPFCVPTFLETVAALIQKRDPTPLVQPKVFHIRDFHE